MHTLPLLQSAISDLDPAARRLTASCIKRAEVPYTRNVLDLGAVVALKQITSSAGSQ